MLSFFQLTFGDVTTKQENKQLLVHSIHVTFHWYFKIKKVNSKAQRTFERKGKNKLVHFPLCCTKCLFLKLIFYSPLTSVCFLAQELLSSEKLLLWFNSTILLIQYRCLFLTNNTRWHNFSGKYSQNHFSGHSILPLALGYLSSGLHFLKANE